MDEDPANSLTGVVEAVGIGEPLWVGGPVVDII